MKRMLWVCLLVFGLILSWTLAYAADFYVIPVKKCCTCKGTLYENRWCDNGDGTVTDMTTCLVWLKYADWGGDWPWRNSSASTPYDDANTRAGLLHDGVILDQSVLWDPVYLSDGSFEGDWRLPTMTELYGLVAGIAGTGCPPPGPCTFYPFINVLSTMYWTSSTVPNQVGRARVVSTVTCSMPYEDKYIAQFVWPVRNGN